MARIEVEKEDIPRASRLTETITAGLTELGYRYVTLDLDGFRSGSLNALLEVRMRSEEHA